jgi:hypothetical protein
LAVRRGHPAVTASDSTLLAINAVRTIQFRSSRRQDAQFCVAIVLARVARSSGPEIQAAVAKS